MLLSSFEENRESFGGDGSSREEYIACSAEWLAHCMHHYQQSPYLDILSENPPIQDFKSMADECSEFVGKRVEPFRSHGETMDRIRLSSKIEKFTYSVTSSVFNHSRSKASSEFLDNIIKRMKDTVAIGAKIVHSVPIPTKTDGKIFFKKFDKLLFFNDLFYIDDSEYSFSFETRSIDPRDERSLINDYFCYFAAPDPKYSLGRRYCISINAFDLILKNVKAGTTCLYVSLDCNLLPNGNSETFLALQKMKFSYSNFRDYSNFLRFPVQDIVCADVSSLSGQNKVILSIDEFTSFLLFELDVEVSRETILEFLG